MSALVNAYRFGGGGGGDPFFANVVALLHFEGADASNTFTDVTGRTWGVLGSAAQIDTAQFQAGAASGLFSADTDAINTASSADFGYGLNDFSVEMFARPAAANVVATEVLFEHRSSTVEGHITLVLGATNKIWMEVGGVLQMQSSNGVIMGQVFQHIALTRKNVAGTRTSRIFVAGTEVCSVTDGTNYPTSSAGLSIIRSGGLFDQFTFHGHVDELRITKGVCRYDANFTPPTGPFPDS